MLKTIARDYLISAAILVFGILVFVTMVVADDITPSVTVGNAVPTITSLSLNGGINITLTESGFKDATTSMTVTDGNGCDTITSVVAKAYIGSTTVNEGTVCTADDNDCYVASFACAATTTGSGTCDGGVDTTATYECGFRFWYMANFTDGGQWSADIWSVSATATDGTDTGTATNTGETVEIVRLNALGATTSIAHGTISANSDSGATNQLSTIDNTGNADIDGDFSGVKMCTDFPTCSGDAADFIAESEQKFGTTSVTYASLQYTLAASTSPAQIDITLPHPTATTSTTTEEIYWGQAVPAGQSDGTYTGQNTISAVND